MSALLLLSLFVIPISYFARYKHGEFTLQLSFLIIFLFTAFRFNYGTDYASYYSMFYKIDSFSGIFTSYAEKYDIEKGWLILCYLFKPVGFFGMIIIITAYITFTYYKLIKKYVPVNYYCLAVFIYVFSFDIMLIQLSAIRQALSIAIFLNSIKYLYEKKSILKYLLLNLIAGSIHSSGYLMIIFVVFAYKNVLERKFIGYAIFIAFFIILFFGQHLIQFIYFISSLLVGDRYSERFDADLSSSATLTGSLFWSLLLFIVLYIASTQPRKYKYLFYFYSLFFMTYVMTNLIFLADRIGYYFAPFSLIVLPQIALSEKDRLLKIGILVPFLILILYRFIHFFTLDFVIDGYSKYQTIFSSLF